MHKTALLVVGILLVVAGLLGVAGTLAFQPASSGGMDAMFIEQMIPHHDDAIAMADLALTRAEHPELKELARDIKRTQTAENATMREWYRLWFGVEVPTFPRGSFGMMGGMMGGGAADLEALRDADSFDKAFIESMVPHHQMALMMSGMTGSNTRRPEMREFTEGIIDTQSREIEMMQQWYQEWYGR